MGLQSPDVSPPDPEQMFLKGGSTAIMEAGSFEKTMKYGPGITGKIPANASKIFTRHC